VLSQGLLNILLNIELKLAACHSLSKKLLGSNYMYNDFELFKTRKNYRIQSRLFNQKGATVFKFDR